MSSPHSRLRRALDGHNLMLVEAAAAECEHIDLPEALEICLLLADEHDSRFGFAAVRWHARLCLEVRLGLDEAILALGALATLRDPARRTVGAAALEGLLDRRGLNRCVDVLEGSGG
jgi:hypothetical protein